jgi:hypothetical protein
MAGTAGLRVFDPGTELPEHDADAILDPAILPTAFGDALKDPDDECVVERAGYYFKIYLPDVTNADDVAGIAESGAAEVGGVDPGGPFPDPNNCEILWCCYAWPVEAESTGNRAFFINQEGDLLQTLNNTDAAATAQLYEGIADGLAVPDYDAAFDSSGTLTGMAANLGITAQGLVPNDGNIWTIVGN